MTKSQIKQLKKLHRKLQELARISKFVPPKLEKRVRKWYIDKLKMFFDGQDLKYHLKKLDGYFEIKSHADDEDVGLIDDGLMIHIYWPASPREKSDFSQKEFVKLFEKEVLNPTKYQIVDQHTHGLGLEATLFVANPRARTKAIKKPQFLYHFAHSKHEKSILGKGLIPKDGPSDFSYKAYKSRIYLITSSPKSWDMDTLGMLSNSVVDGFIVFRIDTRKFNRFNIFEDAEAKGGEFVWTPTHIPAKAVKVIYRWKTELEFLSAVKDFLAWTKRQ